jgi:hypothetical protein
VRGGLWDPAAGAAGSRLQLRRLARRGAGLRPPSAGVAGIGLQLLKAESGSESRLGEEAQRRLVAASSSQRSSSPAAVSSPGAQLPHQSLSPSSSQLLFPLARPFYEDRRGSVSGEVRRREAERRGSCGGESMER